MKKYVFEYLNVAYPNIYQMVTKFGNLMYGWDGKSWLDTQNNMARTIMFLFGLDFDTAYGYMKEWFDSRPKFQSIRTSTNDVVLVPTQTEIYNTTLVSEWKS